MVKTITSVIDITPSYPVFMAGYASRCEKSKGVRDAIEGVIMWLDIDDVKNLFITLDLSNLDYAFVHEIRNEIVKQLPIDKDKIVISATHTHSGPVIVTRNEHQPVCPQYRKEVQEKIIQCALSSYGKEKEVARIVYSHGISSGFYGNRNHLDKYGDNNIYVIKMKDEQNNNIGAIVNISCHSTVLGEEQYELSGDLIASLRRNLASCFHVVPLLTNGNAADMSNRLYRRADIDDELVYMSNGIANQIMTFSPEEQITLAKEMIRQFTYTVKYEENVDKYHVLKQQLLEKVKKTNDHEEKRLLQSQIKSCERKIASPNVNLTFETTIWKCGDVEIVILPCELASMLGKQIKEASAAKVCFIWGYANGLTGYVIEASCFHQGVEGASTRLPKGYAEEYVAKIIQHLFDNEQ